MSLVTTQFFGAVNDNLLKGVLTFMVIDGAWAGMLGVSDAATSADFDVDTIDPTSLLFRARREGRLIRHCSEDEQENRSSRLGAG